MSSTDPTLNLTNDPSLDRKDYYPAKGGFQSTAAGIYSLTASGDTSNLNSQDIPLIFSVNDGQNIPTEGNQNNAYNYNTLYMNQILFMKAATTITGARDALRYILMITQH